ncbi:hypothetical protein DMH17_04435 [Raoultella planticola]|nr:hypothetical protein [Raoultella planticola]
MVIRATETGESEEEKGAKAVGQDAKNSGGDEGEARGEKKSRSKRLRPLNHLGSRGNAHRSVPATRSMTDK